MYSFPYHLFSYFNLISIEHRGFCVHGEFGSRLTTDNFHQIIFDNKDYCFDYKRF